MVTFDDSTENGGLPILKFKIFVLNDEEIVYENECENSSNYCSFDINILQDQSTLDDDVEIKS